MRTRRPSEPIPELDPRVAITTRDWRRVGNHWSKNERERIESVAAESASSDIAIEVWDSVRCIFDVLDQVMDVALRLGNFVFLG